MKALTISQPWASLIASGEKWVENRTWATSYRGPLVIHAGKGTQYLKPREMEAQGLPSGKIVAVADLLNCVRKSDISIYAHNPATAHERRESLGNRTFWEVFQHEYTEGSVCWILANVRKLDEPIPCRGAQTLWKVPPEILERLGEVAR